MKITIPVFDASLCGCKSMRRCYVDMLNTLRDKDEETCIEEVAPGMNTLMVYLKALKQFCPDLVKVHSNHKTYEGRPLFEVVINQVNNKSLDEEKKKPIIFIDSGQHADPKGTILALVVIQQLTACNENSEMSLRVKWVILPSVNPDGMEYGIYNRLSWKKNMRPSDDGLAFGVDLTRNFGFQWSACPKIKSQFSVYYPGSGPFSENETVFIRDALLTYKDKTRAYISIRMNGHSLLHPFAYADVKIPNKLQVLKLANEITNRINQRAGVVQIFVNESMLSMNGKVRCGSSVDYAYDLGIPFCFEMRVFLGRSTAVMAQFQAVPRGYNRQLLTGYVSGLKKLYDVIAAENHPDRDTKNYLMKKLQVTDLR
ncbi:zinc carboxypeptidase A 1-like isoform X2 [Hyposmocoma kahamanoa]|uniref:zinc carboxypeptidase A 1-like isoform X2 n=1 Tax=Hyposmocoma kahamanoa TaxID=1477025 RepID=UPI000E6D9A04|nr:zinc carboxypeptidase A 1-like isoform X2 [Hyposmocoma kahamanoa]